MFKGKQIVASGNSYNALASGTTIKGNIIAEEDLRIDGIVEGNIDCKGKVVVGPTGEVFGLINCLNAELMGKVHGNIHATGTLLLKTNTVYNGEVLTKSLEIEAGAAFNGTCSMIKEGEQNKGFSNKGNLALESNNKGNNNNNNNNKKEDQAK